MVKAEIVSFSASFVIKNAIMSEHATIEKTLKQFDQLILADNPVGGLISDAVICVFASSYSKTGSFHTKGLVEQTAPNNALESRLPFALCAYCRSIATYLVVGTCFESVLNFEARLSSRDYCICKLRLAPKAGRLLAARRRASELFIATTMAWSRPF